MLREYIDNYGEEMWAQASAEPIKKPISSLHGWCRGEEDEQFTFSGVEADVHTPVDKGYAVSLIIDDKVPANAPSTYDATISYAVHLKRVLRNVPRYMWDEVLSKTFDHSLITAWIESKRAWSDFNVKDAVALSDAMNDKVYGKYAGRYLKSVRGSTEASESIGPTTFRTDTYEFSEDDLYRLVEWDMEPDNCNIVDEKHLGEAGISMSPIGIYEKIVKIPDTNYVFCMNSDKDCKLYRTQPKASLASVEATKKKFPMLGALREKARDSLLNHNFYEVRLNMGSRYKLQSSRDGVRYEASASVKKLLKFVTNGGLTLNWNKK